MDFRESLFLAALLLVVVMALAVLRRGPGLMEVPLEHDTFFEGVLDGPLVTGPSRRFPRIPVLSRSDEIRVCGVALRS
jgi:hypothetical protein